MNDYDIFSNKISIFEKYKKVNQSTEVKDLIASLRSSIQKNNNWQYYLIKAMGQWPLASEEFKNGIKYDYLIFEEAFDWPLLARRLAMEFTDLVDHDDVLSNLNSGKIIHEFNQNEIHELFGTAKYRAYLNYWYGVVVEESLHQAANKMLQKDLFSRGFHDKQIDGEAILMHVYEQKNSVLMEEFFNLLGDKIAVCPDRLGVWILYFLFKMRVSKGEPTRVASDTSIAIQRLEI